MRKKRRLTIDFREMRSEFTEESIVNNGLLFMKNCFPYCLLEIIVGDKISRVATNLENMENSGNLKNCQNLRENSEKTQGNLNFWSETWKTQGKCNVCGIIANKNLCNRFSLLSCSGKIWKYPGNLRGKLREFSLSKCGHPEKRWGSCQSPLPGKTLPLRFFLCCVKTVWCRKTKHSDLVSSMDNVDLPL